jgi:hypothetical protein
LEFFSEHCKDFLKILLKKPLKLNDVTRVHIITILPSAIRRFFGGVYVGQGKKDLANI